MRRRHVAPCSDTVTHRSCRVVTCRLPVSVIIYLKLN
uniref:Uncharacterized protein n=1 Tax=Arundo donax TaxID=35708 RepID=A0A0A9C3W9_ARUDO